MVRLFWKFRSAARMGCVGLPRRLQRITLTCGRGARVPIEESLLPRASTVHNNKSTALTFNLNNRTQRLVELTLQQLEWFQAHRQAD